MGAAFNIEASADVFIASVSPGPKRKTWPTRRLRAIQDSRGHCLRARLLSMKNTVSITNAEMDGEGGLLVTLSDGTVSAYVLEEAVLGLKKGREAVREHSAPDSKLEPSTIH